MTQSRQQSADPSPAGSFLADDMGIQKLFGPAARFYVPLFRQLIPCVFQVDYEFEDPASFARKLREGVYDPKESNRIVWLEILFRAHIVVSGSLYRNCRLIDASVREHRASNLPGWASCLRALLESIGDSADALRAVPATLAENHRFHSTLPRGHRVAPQRQQGTRRSADPLHAWAPTRRRREGQRSSLPQGEADQGLHRRTPGAPFAGRTLALQRTLRALTSCREFGRILLLLCRRWARFPHRPATGQTHHRRHRRALPPRLRRSAHGLFQPRPAFSARVPSVRDLP